MVGPLPGAPPRLLETLQTLELQGRVFEAKEHLQQADTKLLGQTKAVKQFSYQVGAGQKVASLLQVSN